MRKVCVDTLLVPAPLRERLGDAGSDGLIMMFAEANRIATERLERTVREVEERFDQRLNQRMADLRFDILKWNFLFWVTQLAAIIGFLK